MDFCKAALIFLATLGTITSTSELEVAESRYQGRNINSSRIFFDDLCEHLPDGAYPDYYQACRMFFICSERRRAATFWCTKGFVFSLTSGHCVPPDRALCPDPNNPSILDEILHPRTDLVADECTQGDGVYPDFTDGCSSFFLCKGGVKISFRCPGATFYDWKTKSCRSSNNFSCHKLSCDGKEDGLYIDSNSYCRRYFECHAGNLSEYVCPDGTIYNARHHRCTRSSTTRCHGSESAQCAGIPDGYYPDFAADCKVFGLCMNGGLKTFNCPAKTAFNSKTLTCESNAHCPKPDTHKCTGKPNGIYPDYESGCKDFYMCLDGLLTHQGSCPQGKLLNPFKGNCQPSSLVSCSAVMDPDCETVPDGVYPDYDTGCSAYFVCLSKRRVSTSYCSGTELFDIATGKCLPSSFVLCRDHSSIVSPPRLFDTYNCDNRLGMYPEFSSDCQRFITCAYGHIKFHECPEGTWFDPETNLCQKNYEKCKAPFAVATFQCLPGDDGIYVGSNCSEWHECRNGVGFTNICPQGMHYHVQYSKCIESSEICSVEYKIQRRMFNSEDILVEANDSNFNCQSKPNGMYADPSSCRKFHFCVEEKTISYACPSNFSYSRESQRCVLTKGSALCDNTRHKRLDNQQQIFNCDHLEDGMYADFNADCRRYFVCENGKGIPVYCPERQKFNSIKMICDREDTVRCLPPRSYSTHLPRRKQTRQNDELYHVYKPEELYTETYSYIPLRSQPATKSPDVKSRMWDEYDGVYSIENDAPVYTGNRDVSGNTRVLNSIHNESLNKRQYSTKSSSPAPSINLKYTPTSMTYNETTPIYNNTDSRSVKLQQVRTTSRDFDAACRKGDTGFFPDYESGCKMFHICFRTIRKTYSCPSVLLFNPETKNCDLPENVLCNRPEPLLEISFDCKDNINQFIPDYSSGCKNYIGCINNLPYKFSCPKGKIFNTETSLCESENSYFCEYPEEYNGTKLNSYDDNSERAPSFRHVHGIPGQFYFSCSNKPDGFYPDYIRHCHVFYRCVRGKKFSHYCKQGLLFNPESGICDFEENVACSSGNRTTSSA